MPIQYQKKLGSGVKFINTAFSTVHGSSNASVIVDSLEIGKTYLFVIMRYKVINDAPTVGIGEPSITNVSGCSLDKIGDSCYICVPSSTTVTFVANRFVSQAGYYDQTKCIILELQ